MRPPCCPASSSPAPSSITFWPGPLFPGAFSRQPQPSRFLFMPRPQRSGRSSCGTIPASPSARSGATWSFASRRPLFLAVVVSVFLYGRTQGARVQTALLLGFLFLLLDELLMIVNLRNRRTPRRRLCPDPSQPAYLGHPALPRRLLVRPQSPPGTGTARYPRGAPPLRGDHRGHGRRHQHSVPRLPRLVSERDP